ncbi:MAG: NfeD family protein [Acholeplasmataceae bacterium]|jgi:membrane protein implicated in regulation of membrane protease activity|nr:NfeD family protein [Acholeplasmataceae bacterium]
METLQIMAIVVWSIVIVGTIIIELAGPQVVSIWFTLGALVSLILAIFNVELWIQIVVFVGVSLVALAITKPLYDKFLKKEMAKKDVNSLVGEQGRIVELEIEPERQYVEIKGANWEIINEEKFKLGTKVQVIEVEGNKLKVEEK